MRAASSTRPRAIGLRLLSGAVLALLLTGCATYSDSFSPIRRDLAAQNYDGAIERLDKQADDQTNHVLYLLNKGMVLRMKHDYSGSNQHLEAAKNEMERLFTASVSEHALSFLLNDATVSYGGEDYEQVLVHLFMALNYLELGQIGEARVEALQVDEKLRQLGAKVSTGSYTQDAFTLYLTGMIYEDLGERSDAMISYRDAYNAYKEQQTRFGTPLPDMLKLDLLRMATRQGLKNEARRYSKEFGIALVPPSSDAPPSGELVFILNNGLAPIKRERIGNFAAPPDSSAAPGYSVSPGVFVTIALPYYESQPSRVTQVRISAGDSQATSELMENIDAIARASLASHMAAITARSIARAAAKVKIQQAVDRAGNGDNRNAGAALLGSLAVRVASIATERADTRSWLTLPANILIARLPLPPGEYTVKVELLDAGGQTLYTREYPGVVINDARKTYLSQHWIPAAP